MHRLAAESAPLGVLTLAALMERDAVPVKVVDLSLEVAAYARTEADPTFVGFAEYVSALLARQSASIFGFSTMWSTYPLMLRVAALLKERRPGCRVVFGGPQASVIDEGTIDRFEAVDVVVRGEADYSFPTLVAALLDGTPLDRVPGVTFRGDLGEVVRTEDGAAPTDLDAIPVPAYHLHPSTQHGHYLPMELGRGCPFGCSFCSTNDFFSRRFRLKSPDVLLEQMRLVNALYGHTRFDLIHDMFTANRRRVGEITESLRNSNEGFEWYCSARTDCVDQSVLTELHAAGCRGVFFGIESGSARVQHELGKHLDPGEALLRVRESVALAMRTTVSLIVGFPEETRADLAATVDFLVAVLPHDGADIQVHMPAPLSGTPLTLDVAELLEADDLRHDYSHSGWPQSPDDIRLIEANRDLLAPFFHAPLHHLERAYVAELRYFLLSSINRLRWVLVALRQEFGDVLDFFDRWRTWRLERHHELGGPEVLAFYCGPDFVREFCEFARIELAPKANCERTLAMVDYAEALDRVSTEARPLSPSRGPCRSVGTSLVDLPASTVRILQTLRGEIEEIDDVPVRAATRRVEHATQLVGLSPLLAAVLDVCDGTVAPNEIAGRIPQELRVAGIDPRLLAHFAVTELLQEGLLTDPR